ncbi:2-C-methyl-D-erythritol 4-phosphate cytidylyltransferase [Gracilibacillus oryzae]|uniref:2-C-methyl-D-erythritol 4-phosphate cytidylyltransferase n=1 Tax=Gracilibacillus oryzae TaxID=1672701 RepID=A0A7C8KT63_9BACI|nr:2-C-methyl-D-erythritol 4-phosphate cytidylyltransferase [Gracilibacillus oryzae]KAB8127745.1 2-C-methyl-D-erythritol 4-phosphate cytidylyltransferase [Gracilibacillus oryzae]
MVEYHVIVLAAGQGKRMNAGKNKQFIQLQDKPLIVHTLMNFIQDEWCQSIYMVISQEDQLAMEGLLKEHFLFDHVHLVHGGKERQESGYRGIKAIQPVQPDAVVMIHDGARPFVEKKHLHQLAVTAKEEKAVLLAVQVTDTIKRKTIDSVETLDRSFLWAAQTPQAFHYSLIKKVHEMANDQEFLGTDDASLVEEFMPEQQVKIVEGSYQNVKLTTPEDLLRAELILNKKGEA